MQSTDRFMYLTINDNVFYLKNTNNFMQSIPQKEIGQLLENGHL
uniref:Uncharacterized protein n=1 Tax=viral metagenome TaxID=1070528 RepID=A0A6C0B484_9ZZZZ